MNGSDQTYHHVTEPNDSAATSERRASSVGAKRFDRQQIAAMLVVLALLGYVYAPNLVDLSRTWTHDPNYSHGILVVPIALLILWRRSNVSGELPRGKHGARWGWSALVAVLVVRAIFYERGDEWRETATLIPALAALALSFGGWRLLRTAWPAIAFLGFMLPLPPRLSSLLSHPLQQLATKGSCSLSHVSGLWVMAEGQVIIVGTNRLEVAEACNGLSMLMGLAATVAAATILLPLATWKRLILVVSIIPIALLSNIVRIVATAWCYHLLGATAGSRFAHDAAGWLMMPLAMLLVGLELTFVSWLIVAAPLTEPATHRLPIEINGSREGGCAERGSPGHTLHGRSAEDTKDV